MDEQPRRFEAGRIDTKEWGVNLGGTRRISIRE
jgi:hypothetical protein